MSFGIVRTRFQPSYCNKVGPIDPIGPLFLSVFLSPICISVNHEPLEKLEEQVRTCGEWVMS